MSSKRLNRKKYKESEESVTERQSNRKSVNHLSSESDNCVSTQSSINSSPKVSQYFPSRKRSCSSPRSQKDFKSKFTKIKSPNIKWNNRAFTEEENPITYGQNSSEEDFNQKINYKNRFALNKNNVNKSIDKSIVTIDYQKLLSTYESIMDKVIDEDVEQYVDSIDFNNTNCVQNNNNNNSVNNDSFMFGVIANDSNIDCNTYDNKNYTKTTSNIDNNEDFEFESDPEFDEWVSQLNDKQLEAIVKQNVSSKKSDDLDDSFERIIAETPIVAIDGTVDRIETKPIDDLDDDGFESDDSFELAISKLTNEQLLSQQNSKTDSRDDSTAYTSHSSSNLMTLSQIIKAINSPHQKNLSNN
jgi:hypothetical protein